MSINNLEELEQEIHQLKMRVDILESAARPPSKPLTPRKKIAAPDRDAIIAVVRVSDDPQNFVSVAEIYQAYCGYCRAMGLFASTINHLSMQMGPVFAGTPAVRRAQKRITGKPGSQRVWRGLELTTSL